jgi:hypothetical protein
VDETLPRLPTAAAGDDAGPDRCRTLPLLPRLFIARTSLHVPEPKEICASQSSSQKLASGAQMENEEKISDGRKRGEWGGENHSSVSSTGGEREGKETGEGRRQRRADGG